jgi:DNA-binding transcriptional ArsR family regulator
MVTQSGDPFRAIADPTRRAMLDALGARPHSVRELADRFDVSRPAISKHLRILKRARLVRSRREGRRSIYAPDPQPLGTVQDWLEAHRRAVRRSLARLKSHVESQP